MGSAVAKNKMIEELYRDFKNSDAYLQKPTYVDETETIHNVTKILVEKAIQAILVRRKDGAIGILTDSSFVKKVVHDRLDLDGPIAPITTYGLKSIDINDFLFNAQIKMAKYGLKRLIVKDEGKIVGLLDVVSLSSYFSSHTQSTSKLIEDAVTIEDLKDASSKFIQIRLSSVLQAPHLVFICFTPQSLQLTPIIFSHFSIS